MENIPRCGTLPLSDVLAKMPVEELEQSLNDFLVPILVRQCQIKFEP